MERKGIKKHTKKDYRPHSVTRSGRVENIAFQWLMTLLYSGSSLYSSLTVSVADCEPHTWAGIRKTPFRSVYWCWYRRMIWYSACVRDLCADGPDSGHVLLLMTVVDKYSIRWSTVSDHLVRDRYESDWGRKMNVLRFMYELNKASDQYNVSYSYNYSYSTQVIWPSQAF
jgi:hypothetical protein